MTYEQRLVWDRLQRARRRWHNAEMEKPIGLADDERGKLALAYAEASEELLAAEQKWKEMAEKK